MMRMDRGCRLWLHKTARHSAKKVLDWYDVDDLIQDGHIVYARVRERYPEYDRPKHIMALFKTAYVRHIANLQRIKAKQVDVSFSNLRSSSINPSPSYANDLEEILMDRLASVASTDLDLVASDFVLAPANLTKLLKALSDEDNMRKLRRPYRKRKNGVRETRSERLCRIAGIPVNRDIGNWLINYLTLS